MKKIIVFIGVLLIGLHVLAPPASVDNANSLSTCLLSQDFSFDLFKKLVFETCQQPEYVVSQAILETGWFSSRAFKEHNNLFGMKHNKRGFARNKGEIYASYDHWTASVLDYSKWQEKRYNGGNYLNFLDSIPSGGKYYRYAQDPDYREKLVAIIQKWD